MSPTEIIQALGGKHELAALTGAKPNAVTQWHRIGIPSKYWDVVVEHAAARGIGQITFAVLRATKPRANGAQPQQEAA
jgi:deoxyribodipyrimidine photolyase-like uncharacterized protein